MGDFLRLCKKKKKSTKHQKEDRDLSKDLGLSLGFIISDRSLTHFEP